MPSSLAQRLTRIPQRYRQYRRYFRHESCIRLLARGFLASTKLFPKGHLTVRTREHGIPFKIRLGGGDYVVLRELFALDGYSMVPEGLRATNMVDVGSNIGASLLYFHLAHGTSSVCSIEADPNNFALLSENVTALTTLAPVEIETRQAAVWGKQGTVVIDNVTAAECSFEVHEGDPGKVAGTTVKAITLDELLGGVEGTIDLLKCDIEGAEVDVFLTGQPDLSRVEAIVIEFHSREGEVAVSQYFAEQGLHRDDATTLRFTDDLCVSFFCRKP